MRTKRCRVTLTVAERDELRQLITTVKAAARMLMHAGVLLKADTPPGERVQCDVDIAAAVETSVSTIWRVQQRFVEEVECSVLARQCPDRRIPDKPMLAGAVALWEARRNLSRARIVWRFTTADARIRLLCVYPSIPV